MGIWEQLSQYITQYSFVRNALIVCPLIALCSSLLGVTLVLKRFSFIGDGLSHVAFGAMAVASVLNLTKDMPLVLAITILCAVLLLRVGQNAKIKGDAAVAMVSVGALAIGYLILNLFSNSAVWIPIHSDPASVQRVAVYRAVRHRGDHLCPVLQQDFRRDL